MTLDEVASQDQKAIVGQAYAWFQVIETLKDITDNPFIINKYNDRNGTESIKETLRDLAKGRYLPKNAEEPSKYETRFEGYMIKSIANPDVYFMGSGRYAGIPYIYMKEGIAKAAMNSRSYFKDQYKVVKVQVMEEVDV